MLNMIYFAMLVVVIEMAQADSSKLPTTISPSSLEHDESMSATTCPANDMIDQEIQKTKDYFNKNHRFRPCRCGSSDWTRVALYNYSIDECPEGTIRVNRTNPNTQQVITGCDNRGDNIVTVPIPVKGVSYSTVCGRILGLGSGVAFARFIIFNASIESDYIPGVSLTHGPPGNRKHIWSFVAANSDNEIDTHSTRFNCPCSSNIPWPHLTPSYVGNDYFCDLEREHVYNDQRNRWERQLDYSDLLWNGHGCSHNSTCCSFNNPPYFCKNLNYTTTDDIEMRLMGYLDTILFVEIYIK